MRIITHTLLGIHGPHFLHSSSLWLSLDWKKKKKKIRNILVVLKIHVRNWH